MEPNDPQAANEMWRRHSADEALERHAQQHRAGQTHEPVVGPPPYGSAEVNLLAASIVQQERERCARIVERWPVAGSDMIEVLARVAAEIRRPA